MGIMRHVPPERPRQREVDLDLSLLTLGQDISARIAGQFPVVRRCKQGHYINQSELTIHQQTGEIGHSEYKF
jgi:hypothetical protein